MVICITIISVERVAMSKREVIKCLIDNHNTEMTVKELTDKIPRANRFTIEKNVRLLRKAN